MTLDLLDVTRSEPTLFHSDDRELDALVGDAASKACQFLDGHFPGWNAGGIGDGFHAALRRTMLSMLAGNGAAGDELRPLVLTDEALGFRHGNAKADGWLPFCRTRHAPWDADSSVLVLMPNGDGFSAWRPSAVGDAFTSFEAARDALMDRLRRSGNTSRPAEVAACYRIAPVFWEEKVGGRELGLRRWDSEAVEKLKPAD